MAYCLTTAGGIAFDELAEGSEINYGHNPRATRKLRCAWADAPDLAKELWGISNYIGGVFFAPNPAKHPMFNGLVCNDVTITPLGKPTGAEHTWAEAILTVDYGLPITDNFLEFTYDHSVETSTRAKEAWEFVDENKSTVTGELLEDMNVSVQFLNMNITQYKFPTDPTTVITSLLGKVNNAVFFGHAIGTVLYSGATVNSSYFITDTSDVVDDKKYFTIRHSFLVSPFDHRKKWNEQTGSYQFVRAKFDNTLELWGTGDFSQLGIFNPSISVPI